MITCPDVRRQRADHLGDRGDRQPAQRQRHRLFIAGWRVRALTRDLVCRAAPAVGADGKLRSWQFTMTILFTRR